MGCRCRFGSWWVVGLLLLLTGCGSGLITGIVAGSDSRRPAPPELTLLQPQLPLAPSPGTTVTVLIRNSEIAVGTRLEVILVADSGAGSIEVEQSDPQLSVQSGAPSVTFTLVTTGMPRTADLAGRIVVKADGRPIGEPKPVDLLRQPIAVLATAGPSFVSAGGGEVELLVAGLRVTAASQLQVLVHVPDPDAPPVGKARGRITRAATDVELVPNGDGTAAVRATLPGNTFPVQAVVEVRDAIAGESTPITDLFYQPRIDLVSPSQGPTTGTSEPTLIGIALVPRDFGIGGAAPLRFGDVELSFRKGGRRIDLPASDLLVAQSDSEQLRFRMPSSPDGRPGPVDIRLRVWMERVDAEGNRTRVEATVTATGRFLFANPDPFFGPRGTVLEQAPVAVAPILLDSATGALAQPDTEPAVDFMALTEIAGVAHLQLLLAQGNGMFQRFAAPRQIGSHEQPAERGPRDLCVGDFDGDAVPDVFVVNAGAASAVHQIVLGQVRPLPPLGDVRGVVAAGGSSRGRVADFDGDGRQDVLLVPGPEALPSQLPHVLLSRPLGIGRPAFAAPVDVLVRDYDYEAVEVADLDGDTVLDIAVANGTTGRLDVAYGNGDGTFTNGVALDIAVPALQSRAVSLHALRDGLRQSLAVALAGRVEQSPSPAVAILRQDALRVYSAPAQGGILQAELPAITTTLVENLDEDPAGQLEMLVAFADGSELLLLQLRRDQDLRALRFDLATAGTVLTGSEPAREIRSLTFDRAFPRTAGSDGARAVFVVHETLVGGELEQRLSTRLIPPQSALQVLPSDAGGQVEPGFEDLVAGNFSDVDPGDSGPVRNLALLQQASPGQASRILLIENDGFGGFPGEGARLERSDLLVGSLTLMSGGSGTHDRLLFGTVESVFGVWDPAATGLQLAESSPLRLVSDDPLLRGLDLAPGTCVVVGDVDGDGYQDAVVLLSFGLAGAEQSAIALLRGKSGSSPGEFPFEMPTALTPVHGRSTALVLGDFAADGAIPPRLELAVAVPDGTAAGGVDGNHVRFFRYRTDLDRFVPGAAAGGPQVLLAGDGPTALAAADFDRDGSVDLLVAGDDGRLRLFRNSAGPDPDGGVVVGSFVLAGAPQPVSPGLPRRLQLGDINGDGSVDAIVGVEFTSPLTQLRSTTVAVYLSTGTGEFGEARPLSTFRLGQRNDRLVFDLGDWNSDDVLDLLVGWNTVQPRLTGNNLRVLFGGTR
ncbi:MAG: VCBS repeat-containing protein [Planctomycetes bacterium]|jgi:hypothetical protein|nr:VCBS repeat-containing protein [Planctomycetota bacterium]